MSDQGNTSGVQRAEELLKRELYYQGLHRAECKRFRDACQGISRMNINLGCGAKVKPLWCNVDIDSRTADFRLDLREEWPFESGSANLIYSEHFFEHLEYPSETSHYLSEVHRVLRPGGILHIGVPGTSWLMQSYGKIYSEYWKLAKSLWHPPSCQTQMHHINHHFRQEGQHRYAWDEETLIYEITSHGFLSAALRYWDSDLDSEDRKINTIYATARKA